MNYQEFLNKKVIVAEDFGFEPLTKTNDMSLSKQMQDILVIL